MGNETVIEENVWIIRMTSKTFTTLIRYGLVALFFLTIGAAAAMLLGSVGRCLQ